MSSISRGVPVLVGVVLKKLPLGKPVIGDLYCARLNTLKTSTRRLILDRSFRCTRFSRALSICQDPGLLTCPRRDGESRGVRS
jgi:hypothetical protein